jgi:hypothetical protein
MKTNFVNRFKTVTQQANDFISQSVKDIVILIDDKSIDDDDDLIYELPFVTTINKYDQYDEWAVSSVENKDNLITLHTIGKGERSGEKRNFGLEEIDNTNVVYLADLIAEKL